MNVAVMGDNDEDGTDVENDNGVKIKDIVVVAFIFLIWFYALYR